MQYTIPPEIRSLLPSTANPPRNTNSVLSSQTSQWLFTPHELAHTPSILDGMPLVTERELRGKGLNFITQVGVMLKLPQLTLGTASVYFNRFLMRQSLVSRKDRKPLKTDGQDTITASIATPKQKALHHFTIAAIALHLSTKTSETPRKLKEIIVACCRIAQRNPDLMIDEQSKDFWRWRDGILNNEPDLLEALCFDLEIQSPHRELMGLMLALGVQHEKGLRQRAWTLCNDSCVTVCCLRFDARVIAVAAIYAAARLGGEVEGEGEVKIRDDELGRPWWEGQGVKLEDIRGVCEELLTVFEHQTPGKVRGEQDYWMYGPMDAWVNEDAEVEGEGGPTRLRVDAASPARSVGSQRSTLDVPDGRGIRQTSVKRERDGTPKINPPLPPSAAVADSTNEQRANTKEDRREEEVARDIKINANEEDSTRTLSPRKRRKPSPPRVNGAQKSGANASQQTHRLPSKPGRPPEAQDGSKSGGSEEGEVSE